MHPSTEQLLAGPDPSAPPDIQEHLERCSQCRAQLHSAWRTRDRLISLPQLEPPDEAWTKIQAALQAPSRASSSGLRYVALAASIAALAILVMHLRPIEETMQPAAPTAHTESAQANEGIATLMEQSRHLDLMLQGLPNRPRVERVAMAATLDSIEERIQWLDMQLTYAAAAEDETRTQTLWRERVDLMDSLVKVRYAQAGSASF